MSEHDLGGEQSSPLYARSWLRRAFLAGWSLSAEGYNAEYGPEDDEIQYLYREWLAEYGLDTGGSAASQKYLP